MLYRSAEAGCFILINCIKYPVHITPFFHINQNRENIVFLARRYVLLNSQSVRHHNKQSFIQLYDGMVTIERLLHFFLDSILLQGMCF